MAKNRNKKQKRPDVCDQLRQAIEATGWTPYRVAKLASVKPEIVTRFMKSERDIRAATFAKIAGALGLALTPREEATDG